MMRDFFGEILFKVNVERRKVFSGVFSSEKYCRNGKN